MKKIITIPLILLLFAVPSIAQAQYDEDDYDYDPNDETIMLGPRLGYYEAPDAEDGAWTIGLQLRTHLNEWFGLEVAASYRSSSEYTLGVPGNYSVESGFIPITASALIYLPVSEHFWPYGIAGIGAYYTFTDVEGIPDDLIGDNDFEGGFNFGYHLGFGLEIPISNDLAINADYRYVWLTPNNDEFDVDYGGHAVTVGLMFYL